ncbi:hypothetical protein [Hydrogenimonas sp.]|uniref:hypothetical protein n=1 Tax=Hydrogenimonas sp. TaxID=2231112 RepID=UPI0026147F6B|nr:hypothetical protein [Hydrogenimonas sp.]
MNIALNCHSVLIEKSLRKFLKHQLVAEHDADILITDHHMVSEKPLLRIGMDPDADLKKPFSRSQLMIKLEEKIEESSNKKIVEAFTVEEEESLEEKIERATRLFVDELVTIIKGHYESRP